MWQAVVVRVGVRVSVSGRCACNRARRCAGSAVGDGTAHGRCVLLLLAGKMKDRDVGTLRHFDLADLPVHCFGRPPWQRHFLRDLLPHVFLESASGMLVMHRLSDHGYKAAYLS